MSKFSDAKIYSELIQLFEDLNNQLAAAREALSLPDVDARHVGLRGMQLMLAGYFMGFNSMIHGRTKEQIIESFGRTNFEPDEALKCIEDAWKLGLLTLLHFKLDSFFQNLLRANGTYRERSGFASMVDQKIALATPVKRDYARNILLLTGYLRNSLHNNSMHRSADLQISFLDLDYDLRTRRSIALLGDTSLPRGLSAGV